MELKKTIKIVIVIFVLMILLPSICFGAGSDELYAYLCEGSNAPIYKLNSNAAEVAEIYSQAISIWCKANDAEVVRENEKITIKYNNEEIDLGTVYNYIENELQKNTSYNENHSVINSPETNFGAKAIEYIANNQSDWIYNRVGEISGVELTTEEENNQATVTLPNNETTTNNNYYDEEISNFDTDGEATNEQKIEKLSEIVLNWCRENNIEVSANSTELGGEFYKDGNIIEMYEIIDSIKGELNSNANKNKLEILVQNTKILDIAYNGMQFRDIILETLATEQNVNINTDPNDNPIVDPGTPEATPPESAGISFGDMFQKAMDALLGIALYPLKAIILALGGIFNLIIDGIASIGGATNGIISLQDIIYTTTTKSAKAGINPVPIVAIDFFNFDNNVTTEIGQIRQGIANWFYVFRNLSIVISLCILIYTGIRMAISSIAEDKAKYKSMITNWFIQMVLVFFMQYIIFFTIGVNNAIVDALNPVLQNDTTNYMAELYKQAWNPLLTVGFGSAIVYCILLGMTFSFLIIYIKRMITIGFLIIISPLVTVTYAIDKMGDSKSQALNTWLKEFVYNILIQPFHCVIYAVFVSTAMTLLTVSNIGNFGAPVFAILCIMFMNKAEDILRKIFAFDKHAKTLGSGLASAAMIGAGLSTVSSLFKKEESTKKTGDAGAMPNIEATHKSYVEQKTIDNQIDEAQQASDKAADKIVQNNNGIQKTARQIEKDRRKNRAIESWQNAGGIGGMAMKGAQMQAKAALPVLSAFLGAGQGNLKSMIGAGTAGYAIERGIENAVEKRAKPSQVELSRQAKANEAALGVIYQEQAQKWTKEGGRWAGFSKEEILNDIKYLATMDNINELKKEDERHFAHVLQEGVSSYAALGQNMPVGDLVEFIRRQQG